VSKKHASGIFAGFVDQLDQLIANSIDLSILSWVLLAAAF
jgi:hypothetical protein